MSDKVELIPHDDGHFCVHTVDGGNHCGAIEPLADGGYIIEMVACAKGMLDNPVRKAVGVLDNDTLTQVCQALFDDPPEQKGAPVEVKPKAERESEKIKPVDPDEKSVLSRASLDGFLNAILTALGALTGDLEQRGAFICKMSEFAALMLVMGPDENRATARQAFIELMDEHIRVFDDRKKQRGNAPDIIQMVLKAMGARGGR